MENYAINTVNCVSPLTLYLIISQNGSIVVICACNKQQQALIIELMTLWSAELSLGKREEQEEIHHF